MSERTTMARAMPPSRVAHPRRQAQRCVCSALLAAALVFLLVLMVLWTPVVGLGAP